MFIEYKHETGLLHEDILFILLFIFPTIIPFLVIPPHTILFSF